MSCLIIKNDGIGDLILSSGLIRSIAEHFGGEADLLTCSNNAEIAEGISPLRHRYYVSRDSINYDLKYERFGIQLRRVPVGDKATLDNIGNNSYQTVICLRRFIRQSTLVIMQAVRGKNKYCAWEFPTNCSRKVAERASRGWKHLAGSERVLSELEYHKSFVESVLSVTLDASPRLSFCARQGCSVGGRTLALGLGGGSAKWPVRKWVELSALLSRAGWRLVLLGGIDAAELAAQISSTEPDVDNQVGRLSWRQTAGVLAKCDGYVGNDTGLSHFASLLLDRCLIILGGGTFRRFFPWPGNNNQYIIFHGLDCFDCDWACKFHERSCLELISPLDVFAYFERVMAGTAPAELDLNPANADYQLSWRRKVDSGRIFVRPV